MEYITESPVHAVVEVDKDIVLVAWAMLPLEQANEFDSLVATLETFWGPIKE